MDTEPVGNPALTLDPNRLAVEAVANVYLAASNLFYNIQRRLQDIQAMWTLYHQQGLVPETDVIENLIQETKKHIMVAVSSTNAQAQSRISMNWRTLT